MWWDGPSLGILASLGFSLLLGKLIIWPHRVSRAETYSRCGYSQPQFRVPLRDYSGYISPLSRIHIRISLTEIPGEGVWSLGCFEKSGHESKALRGGDGPPQSTLTSTSTKMGSARSSQEWRILWSPIKTSTLILDFQIPKLLEISICDLSHLVWGHL